MKRAIYILAMSVFMAITVSVGCQSTDKKDEEATETQELQMDTIDTGYDAAVQKQKAADADEWQKFKDKTNAAIEANEIRIAELKVKMKNTEKSIDAVYSKNIETLEQKNKDLKVRMDNYKNDTKNDWESFKIELDHDVDELDKALKDFTVNNEK